MLSNKDRARQFLPFDALKGFKESLREVEKYHDNKYELTEELVGELNYNLKRINNESNHKKNYFEDNIDIKKYRT